MRQRKFIFRLCSVLVILFVGTSTQAAEQRPIDGIEDNSFLVEEAYNQDPGVVQHIFNAVYTNDFHRHGWSFTFTQEWPLYGLEHQISYSIPSFHLRDGGDKVSGVGDVLINYRYQALEEGDTVPAFAPRFSLILPAGNRDKETGNGVVGYQWSLPFSKKVASRLALHANLGLTYLPKVRVPLDDGHSPKRSLVSPNLGASAIFALTSRIHLMLEWVGTFEQSLNDEGKRERDFKATISPGIRAAVINTENLQTVLGVGIPIGLTRPADNYGVFLYFSVEHKFF
ncbi:MAG: transporter [Deltaproteobacteria bacterium]|nr:MAG: transporter [Deltaproteobacteria bacterium]